MGYRAPLVEDASLRMTELGYLDDEAFARAWVASRDRARPRGEHALRRELQLKGVDRSLIDASSRSAARKLATDVPAGHDGLSVRTIWPRSAPATEARPDPARERPPQAQQRAYALLARSGFAPDVCATATKRVLDDPATTARDADPGLDETDLDGRLAAWPSLRMAASRRPAPVMLQAADP